MKTPGRHSCGRTELAHVKLTLYGSPSNMRGQEVLIRWWRLLIRTVKESKFSPKTGLLLLDLLFLPPHSQAMCFSPQPKSAVSRKKIAFLYSLFSLVHVNSAKKILWSLKRAVGGPCFLCVFTRFIRLPLLRSMLIISLRNSGQILRIQLLTMLIQLFTVAGR